METSWRCVQTLSSRSDVDIEPINPLQEPESFRPKTPPPTEVAYTRRHYGGVGEMLGEQDVRVGLVSGHPLWGELLL